MVGVSYAYTLYVIINNLHSPFIPTLPSFKWQNRRVTLKSTSLLNPTIINHFSNFAFSIRPCAALFNKRNDITFKVVKNPFKATFYQGSLRCILYWVVGVRFDLDIALKHRDCFWSYISYCMLSPILIDGLNLNSSRKHNISAWNLFNYNCTYFYFMYQI